jgi:hypothetical protein
MKMARMILVSRDAASFTGGEAEDARRIRFLATEEKRNLAIDRPE